MISSFHSHILLTFYLFFFFIDFQWFSILILIKCYCEPDLAREPPIVHTWSSSIIWKAHRTSTSFKFDCPAAQLSFYLLYFLFIQHRYLSYKLPKDTEAIRWLWSVVYFKTTTVRSGTIRIKLHPAKLIQSRGIIQFVTMTHRLHFCTRLRPKKCD